MIYNQPINNQPENLMFDLIDIYQKVNGRWVYIEGTRMHRTLAAAQRHAAEFHGCEIQARFA